MMEDRLRVVLIDPVPRVRTAIETVVSPEDELVVVDSVDDALEVFCLQPVDVIFICMDRFSLASTHQVTWAGTRRHPGTSIIATTTSVVRAVAALEAGATDVMIINGDEKNSEVAARAALKRAAIFRKYLITSELLVQKEKELCHLKSVLHELTIRDSVTGVYTYEYFYDALCRDISMAQRYKEGLALLFVNICGFRAYADAAGEGASVDLLRTTAMNLTDRLRRTDVISRHGRSDFIVLLPDMASGESENFLKQLKGRIVESLEIPHSLRRLLRFEFRMAWYPTDAGSADALIRAVTAGGTPPAADGSRRNSP